MSEANETLGLVYWLAAVAESDEQFVCRSDDEQLGLIATSRDQLLPSITDAINNFETFAMNP